MHYLVSLIILAFAAAPLHAKVLAAPAAKKDSMAARRVLSYSQFVKEMVECTAAVYRLENAELRFNRETDMKYTSTTTFNDADMSSESYPGLARNYSKTIVKPIILLSNITLNTQSAYDIAFYNFQFEGGISIGDTVTGTWGFTDCVFYPSLQGLNLVSFFMGGVVRHWYFFRGTFSHLMHIYGSKINWLQLENCKVGTNRNEFVQHRGNQCGIIFNENTIEDLHIDSSSFAGYTMFGQNTFTNIQLNKSTIQMFDFSSVVQRTLSMDSCTFTQAADFTNAQFPHKNAMLPFAQFANKFAIQNDTISYFARNDAELADDKKYNKLIALYTDFLSLYKTRGDQESYNACYVEMKQIHTRRAGYLYRKSPALETWFDWRLNQLLEVFSDYGTNAAKGLIYIFYVIIGFAALYLIFPSEADNLSREKSFRMFDVVIGYFSTNATLVNISEHKRRRALDDLQNFRTTLEVSRKDVPAFIALLGAPLYGLNKAYLGFSAWLVKRFDIVPGKWNELSAGRKAWTGAAVGAYMLGFLVWGVVMRFVNAFALSINAFVTLGYGEIQARGVARYLAVLEGAVGWFLLSIFSVTLISQLLQ